MSQVIHGRCEKCKVYIYIPTDGEGRYVSAYNKDKHKKNTLVCSYCLLGPVPIENRFDILDL